MPEKMRSWSKLVAGTALSLTLGEHPVHANEARAQSDAETTAQQEKAKKVVAEAKARGYILPTEAGAFEGQSVIDKDGYMVGAAPLPPTREQQVAINPLLTYQRETCLMIPQGTIESMDPQKKLITIKTFTGQKIIYQPTDSHFFEAFKPGEKIGYKIVYRGSKARPVEFICRLPFITYSYAAPNDRRPAASTPEAAARQAIRQKEAAPYILAPKPRDTIKPGDEALWVLERLYGTQPTIPPLRMSDKMIATLSEVDARRNPGIDHKKIIPPLRGPGDKAQPALSRPKK